VFENIIEQGAVSQLRDDILGGNYAPSMLFYGPSESGKGSAALELARVLSCEGDSSWKCSCPSCERHRYLQHDDLLMLGKKSFASEIAACSSVILKNPSSQSAKIIFYRSLRKLQLRFPSILIEDDPKTVKFSSVLQSFDERLNELLLINGTSQNAPVLEKLCAALVKDAAVLENEGLNSVIHIGHIRNASYWCRLAPSGKKKVIIMENVQNMREEARNSLLKLLEEPPAAVNIVLTSQRREAIMLTILSRLRPYRFLKRSAEGEKEVLRRVFQETAEPFNDEGSIISSYLESFLSQNNEKLYPLAVWFVVSIARIAALSYKKKSTNIISSYITALGNRYAPIAESYGFERIVRITPLVKILVVKSGNFENDSFSRFLKLCLELFAAVSKEAGKPEYIAYNESIIKIAGEAGTAVDVLNINTTLALEAFSFNLKNVLARG
jgi:DNA polymerase-3 subunit gamma/tau